MTDTLPLAKTDVGNERANLPPLPWDWTVAGAPSNNGAFHAYLVDATGRKIAAIWGKGNEKAAIGDAILNAVNSHDALVKVLEEIAATNIERETVTPVNSFRAFGQANSELIRLRDIARAALKARAKEQV